MKKLLSILLLSVILFGCSKDPLKKSVIEPLEINEIKQILKYEDERSGISCCFELFYERVQVFHELTKNDNLIKVKFEDLLYVDYWKETDYLMSFDKTSLGYIYSDSIKSLVDNSGWKKVPMYISIFDTLSSVEKMRKKVEEGKRKYGIYWLNNSDIELEMGKFIRNKIKITNDSINEIYEKGKSDKILLFEEFNRKMSEVKVKNRRR
tara:strand:- start:543 stop:1166 length:624 start_codon:yes stop_codon:yes gene_type:complete